MKKLKIKYIHIGVIIIGILIAIIASLHNNIWYDESYTVANIQNHSLLEMFSILSDDVHPFLYYILLEIYTSIIGNNDIIILRLFSVLGMFVLSILGYTHIRKDFGEKMGLFFSFFVLFLPTSILYMTEIRMYSWTPVFVTLAAIYAYRIYQKIINRQTKLIKESILFILFSVMSAYTHYYGLLTVVVINAILTLFTMLKVKNRKIKTKILIIDIIQILLWIPGAIIFLQQTARVVDSYWINIKYPTVFMDIIIFFFQGKMTSNKALPILFVIASIIIVYSIIKAIKYARKSENQDKSAVISISIIGIILIIAFLFSVKREIFVTRYMMCFFGLFSFFLAQCVAKEKKSIQIILTIIILAVYTVSTAYFIKANYNKANEKITKIIQEESKETDIILYDNLSVAGPQTFQKGALNQYLIREKRIYLKAYEPDLILINTIQEIEDNSVRIWVIEGKNRNLTKYFSEQGTRKKLLEKVNIVLPYKNTYTSWEKYNITLWGENE